MPTASTKRRRMDVGRLASLRIRLAAALHFRGHGLPGADEPVALIQEAVCDELMTQAKMARTNGARSIEEVLRDVLGALDSALERCPAVSCQTPAGSVLVQRIEDFRSAIST